MKTSTHKRIVFAGCGCASLLGLLVVVAILVMPSFDSEPLDKPSEVAPRAAEAALDSLARTTLVAVADLPRGRRYGLAPGARQKKGDGALTAVRLWRSPTYQLESIQYGDTFPVDSRARLDWLEAGTWRAVDSLLLAAGRPWSLVGALRVGRDSAGVAGLGRPLAAPPVLSTTRALLAAARLAADTGETEAAAEILRAAATIGHHLQDDAVFEHVVLGTRVERDAVHMLSVVDYAAGRMAEAGRDEARAYVARLDSNLVTLRTALRQIRFAGARPANVDQLAVWVRDRQLPSALRRELVLAVAFGWTYSSAEVTSGLAPARAAALAFLDSAGLPEELSLVVRAGQEARTYDLFKRIGVAVDFKSP